MLIGVGVNAQPRSGTVSCGPTQTVIFTASVAAQRAGTINYAWRPDDRVDASPRTGSMTFDSAQEKHTQFTVPRNGTSGQRLQGNVIFQVTAPEADRQLAGDEFDLTCQ